METEDISLGKGKIARQHASFTCVNLIVERRRHFTICKSAREFHACFFSFRILLAISIQIPSVLGFCQLSAF
eukprot:1203080-Pleurochrysis_carterae.AAC.1